MRGFGRTCASDEGSGRAMRVNAVIVLSWLMK